MSAVIKMYNTGKQDFWGNDILKSKTHLFHLIDGKPYHITDDGEPLYLVSNYAIITTFNKEIETLEIQKNKAGSLLLKLVKHNRNPLTMTPHKRYYDVLSKYQSITKQLNALYQKRWLSIN